MAGLASINEEAILGYYQPFYFFASLKIPPLKLSKPPSELQHVLSPEQLFGYALARYTFVHEIRHFHDYFGTMAGISLFSEHLRQLRAFANFFEAVRSEGKPLEMPLNDAWLDSEPYGEIAKGLTRNWHIFLKSTAAFTDAFIKTAGEGHHGNDHVIYKKDTADNRDVPTFPLSMAFGSPGGQLEPITIYYPVGLEVLVEGNAQAIQRSLMEDECSKELADRLVPSMRPQPIESDDPIEYMKANALPYNVTDLLVSKFLRLRGQPTFQRRTILQLTDQALGLSYIKALSKPWEVPAKFQISDIGRIFIKLLEDAPLKDLVDGTLSYPDEIGPMYRVFLDHIEKSPKPEDIAYKQDFISPINMMEAVASHHIIAPLLRARLETNHEVFYSVPKYIEKWIDLPSIPVMFPGDENALYAPYMNLPSVADAWIKYCMLTSVMHELYTFKPHLSCFRSQQLNSSAINLCENGTCSENIAAMRCQEWRQGDPLPDCLFASTVRHLRLTS